jgi:ATP-binding cassette subfamily B protein
VVPGDTGVVQALAGVVAAVAILDAALSLLQRWFSARIGEGFINDMRSQVFYHVQRQPLAFFTRTHTGVLITRLYNDVLGAQSAFTNTLASVLSNLLSVTFTLAAMIVLSWQVTLVSLALLPVFLVPARQLAPKLAALTRESYGRNAAMNTTMAERVQRVRGDAGEALRPARTGTRPTSASTPRGSATSASRRPCSGGSSSWH